MPASPATIVLVHGTWHDGGCWAEVGRHLRSRGVRWLAPTLPSTGPWPTGSGPVGGRLLGGARPAGFGADVAAVLAVIRAIDGEVVLCGHGYGGMVISEAGNHPAVTRLVYLAAFCPLPGESVHDLVGTRWPAPLLGPLGHRSDRGRSELTPAWARRRLYGDLPRARAAALVEGLRPSSASVFDAAVGRPAWRYKPALYAVCRRDRVLGPRRSAAMAERVVHNQLGHARYLDRHVITLNTGHAPFFSAPGIVADVVQGRF